MLTEEGVTALVQRALDPEVLAIFRKAGTEDYGAIFWATFSDDDGDPALSIERIAKMHRVFCHCLSQTIFSKAFKMLATRIGTRCFGALMT